MLKSYSFPSVYEATNQELQNVAESILDGIKINVEGTEYIVGNLALVEGYSPHKDINPAPTDIEYKLLSDAGLLLTQPKGEEEVVLTTGFPFSTYTLYREKAMEVLQGRRIINYDASTFGGPSNTKREINVGKVEIIPEILGCTTAIREGDLKEKDNFFIVSLGYGTCEAVVSTRAGLINRSAISTHGVRHAVNLLANELAKNYYLNLKTEHQVDVIFQQGTITVNRMRHNILDIREKALKMYYRDIIAPNLRRAFTDDDFNKCTKMYLVGGGANYPELVECFKEEFGGIVSVDIYPEPEKCAAHGYCLNSKNKASMSKTSMPNNIEDEEIKIFKNPQLSVGIDIGNANTCITIYKDNE
ncbi:ParM/StbA family protein [Odoribacter sp. OttesenSCG-928-A06]|nr:ParM/StbA family protein [Odoribacter sp. OttesenSCG-928-A06]